MKKILGIFLILLFSTIKSYADRIQDFELEGFSVGQSLLEFTSLDKILSSKAKSQFMNDKYIMYRAEKFKKLENFDLLNINIKKNDKKFIIQGIAGIKFYDTLDECNSLKNEIQSSLEQIFDFNSNEITEFKSNNDKSGKSMVYGIQNYFKPYPSVESIIINCYHFTKESGLRKNLKVSISTEGYAYFIINEAYK